MVPALQALVLVQQEIQIAADQVAEQPSLVCGHLSIGIERATMADTTAGGR